MTQYAPEIPVLDTGRTTIPALSENRNLRLTATILLYFMQSVVVGLSTIAIAASLFALFMAVPSLGRALIAGSSGWVVEGSGYAMAYYGVAALSVAGLLFCLLSKFGVGEPAHAAKEAAK